ncbi:GDSL/SGNH-like acyl-esterase family found in Pmr5 and Cas1p-domain-containing protein [Leucosporidium creatinivorum]|uniref:GDSL/SGNH-like acyl-esterase family found in Pmr5 and Cas1p-domain-containing protein n=1 Tax=Leucosporidium creatinivorum TaxID=106004 RepID=A0A1Y2FBI7_9BASI|nr:GDSL/SGNH-like acyl-esterase family found in Pmr5 and Cas1p-domain-containing protein [Leucosporidium creatinivorum]
MSSYASLIPPKTQRTYTIAVLLLGLFLVLSGTWRQRDHLPTFDALAGEPYCASDQLAVGQWLPIQFDARTWPILKDSAGYLCSDNRHALMCGTSEPSQLPRLAAANSWRWKPQGCALRPFDAAALSHRLGANSRKGTKGRGILFVGDSLQLQQVQSFECLMGRHVQEGFISDYEVGSLELSNGAGKLEFVRTDYTVQPEDWTLMYPETEEPANHTRFDRKWTHMVEDKEFVVLNTGAHWGDHRSMWIERYTNMAKEVIAFIDQFPHITLIVRTSVPGHTNCSQYSAPLLEDDPDSHNSYNWQGFTLFNNVWRDILAKHPKHILLDVGATSLRGDGHRNPDVDCLHYCLPGPVDTWNTLLYHIIMGL